MGPISMLFGNPAVKVLEEHLWESARQRYLQEHPSDRDDDPKTLMRKAKNEYKDRVEANLKDAKQKVMRKWGQFKHAMADELIKALTTVLRMSDVDWYALELGTTSSPEVIAVPYQLLKHMSAALLVRLLKKDIEFEDLDDETLAALAGYAAEERFHEILEDARRHYSHFEIGSDHAHFFVIDVMKSDPYFLGEEQHPSRIDMVVLGRAGEPSGWRNKSQKRTAKKWFNEGLKNRSDDRRFSGDGWELGFDQLKSWTTAA